MKPVTITIPEELDRRAGQEARRRGVSKSELFRRGLLAVLPEEGDVPSDDPLIALAGFASPTLTAEPGEIDRVVYGL